jgi:tetratricopeptide (TPR) repeat protein
MTRRRIAIALVAAGLAVVATLLGGVLDGGPSKQAAPPVAASVPDVANAEQAMQALLDGLPTGDTASLVRALEQNVERDRTDANSLTLLGLAYQQRARETADPAFYSLSERALRRALEIQPGQPLVTTGLAALAVSRHRFNDALVLARKALAENADDAGAWGALGDALLSLGRYDEAFDAFDRAVELAPSVGSFARVSYARELLGRPDDAIAAIEYTNELRVRVPEHAAYASVQLGNLYFNTGRLAEAETAYRAALQKVSGYISAEAGLARVEAARGRFDAAIARLRSVVDRLPTTEHAMLLAEVLQAAGRPGEAREAYDLAATVNGLLASNGVRTDLQEARLDLDRNRDAAGALRHALTAYDAAPGISAEDTLAWALFENDRCAEAETHSIQAMRLGTQDALLFFHRGMIERCLGNTAAAREHLTRALDLNPNFSFVYAPTARLVLEELAA